MTENAKKALLLATLSFIAIGLSLFSVPGMVDEECSYGKSMGQGECRDLAGGTQITKYGLPLTSVTTYSVYLDADGCKPNPLILRGEPCDSDPTLPEPKWDFVALGINIATWFTVFGVAYSLMRRQKVRKKKK